MQARKIFAIHGLGGHSGWFKRLAEELSKYGIELYAYDLPGFGKNHILSGEPSHYIQGHVESFSEWIDFCELKFKMLKNQFPDEKFAVLGHSLGAVIACNMKNIDENDRLILSVPAFKGAKATFNPLFVMNALWKYFFDKLICKQNVFLELPVSEKAQDTPAMSDPLRVSSVTQNLLFEILQLHGITEKNLTNIFSPTLMIQIDDDKVVDNNAQRKMFARIGSMHKTLKTYEGADHDWIWYDIVETIAKDIADWLLMH